MYLVYGATFARIRKAYFKRMIEYCRLPPRAKILDYGCGPGDLLIIAREIGLEPTGIDSSPRSVELARQRGLDVILGDVDNLTPTAQFDVIILQSVLEHLDRPIEALQKLVAFLRPEGTLVLSAPTPGPYFWDDPTHVRPFTPHALRTIGEIVGVEVLLVSYVFSFLLGFTMTSSLVYRAMNVIPLPLGSNLVAFYRKRPQVHAKEE